MEALFGDTPVDKLYREAAPLQAGSLKEMSERIAKLPLLYEPGDHWVYSMAVDVQGCIVEKLSGMPLDVFLQKRIFEPLGMKDTGFYVPAEKRAMKSCSCAIFFSRCSFSASTHARTWVLASTMSS